MTDPKELRAGHGDRNRVISLLEQAYAEGHLTAEELPERIEATRAARTFGDLDKVTADLPLTAAPSPVGGSPENPLIVDGGWWADKRTGAWEIPQFVRLRGGMGSVVLDCTEAMTEHQVIHLWVEGDLGSITIIVPEGWAADATALAKAWGSVHIKVPKEPTMGRPTLVANGTAGMGSLTIRHPNWFERRRLEKRLR